MLQDLFLNSIIFLFFLVTTIIIVNSLKGINSSLKGLYKIKKMKTFGKVSKDNFHILEQGPIYIIEKYDIEENDDFTYNIIFIIKRKDEFNNFIETEVKKKKLLYNHIYTFKSSEGIICKGILAL